MADVKAGKMDPKVANTGAYVATVLLRAHEADAAGSAETPTQPFVPLIYRSLIYRNGRKHEADDVIDLETGERVALPAADVPCALPAPTPSAGPYRDLTAERRSRGGDPGRQPHLFG
jgi:hypothetical protein